MSNIIFMQLLSSICEFIALFSLQQRHVNGVKLCHSSCVMGDIIAA